MPHKTTQSEENNFAANTRKRRAVHRRPKVWAGGVTKSREWRTAPGEDENYTYTIALQNPS